MQNNSSRLIYTCDVCNTPITLRIVRKNLGVCVECKREISRGALVNELKLDDDKERAQDMNSGWI